MANQQIKVSFRQRTWKGKKNKAPKWEYTIRIPKSMPYLIRANDGKEISKCSIFTSKNEAIDAANAKIEELKRNACITDKNMTFKDVCDKFIKHCDNREKYRESTQKSYKGYLKNHLQDFYNVRAIEMKKIQVKDWIDKKVGDTSACTINHCLRFCKAAFNYCIDGEILINNPFARIKQLEEDTEEMVVLRPRQITRMLHRCKVKYPKLYPILYLALYTGMRTGEILGLKWKNIDLEKGKVNVIEQYTNGIFCEPKWGSKRVVDLTQSVIRVLQEYKNSLSELDELVFTGEKNGNPVCIRYKDKGWFKPLLKSLKFPNMKFHALRHTYASIMLSRNVNIKYLSRQLGHKSAEMTLDIYGHLIPDVHEFAVNVLDEAIQENEQGAVISMEKWRQRKQKQIKVEHAPHFDTVAL